MKTKLKLDIDALRVESFETGAGQRMSMGTVRGHSGNTGDTGDFNLDDPPEPSEHLLCATGSPNCGGGTYGCVEIVQEVYIFTDDCPSYYVTECC